MNYSDKLILDNMYKFFPRSNNDLRRNKLIMELRK